MISYDAVTVYTYIKCCYEDDRGGGGVTPMVICDQVTKYCNLNGPYSAINNKSVVPQAKMTLKSSLMI